MDTIPLIVKFFSKPGPYDTLLDREEVKFDGERKAFLATFNRYMKELGESKLLHLTQHKPLERALIEGVDRSRAANSSELTSSGSGPNRAGAAFNSLMAEAAVGHPE